MWWSEKQPFQGKEFTIKKVPKNEHLIDYSGVPKVSVVETQKKVYTHSFPEILCLMLVPSSQLFLSLTQFPFYYQLTESRLLFS